MVLIRVPARTTGGAGGGTSHIFTCSHSNSDPSSNTSFGVISGGNDLWNTGTEALRQNVMGRATTFSRYGIEIPLNSQSSDRTTNFRVNGASVNQSILVGAGLTGFFQDLVNTDAVVLGDRCNYRFFILAAEALQIGGTTIEYT